VSDEKHNRSPDNRLHQLEVTIEGMRLAFNKNHAAYAAALGAVDGHIAVLRSVLNELHTTLREVTTTLRQRGIAVSDGPVVVIPEGAENAGSIDWDTYYGWYNEYLKNSQKEEVAARQANGAAVEALPSQEELFGAAASTAAAG